MPSKCTASSIKTKQLKKARLLKAAQLGNLNTADAPTASIQAAQSELLSSLLLHHLTASPLDASKPWKKATTIQVKAKKAALANRPRQNEGVFPSFPILNSESVLTSLYNKNCRMFPLLLKETWYAISNCFGPIKANEYNTLPYLRPESDPTLQA